MARNFFKKMGIEDLFTEEELAHLGDVNALIKTFNKLKDQLIFTFDESDIPGIVTKILNTLEKFPNHSEKEKEELAAYYSELILTLKEKFQDCDKSIAEKCVALIKKSIEDKRIVFPVKIKTEVVQPTRSDVEECITQADLDALLTQVKPERASDEMNGNLRNLPAKTKCREK